MESPSHLHKLLPQGEWGKDRPCLEVIEELPEDHVFTAMLHHLYLKAIPQYLFLVIVLCDKAQWSRIGAIPDHSALDMWDLINHYTVLFKTFLWPLFILRKQLIFFKLNVYWSITSIQKREHIQTTTQQIFTKWAHLYNQHPDEGIEYCQLSEAPSCPLPATPHTLEVFTSCVLTPYHECNF